MLRRDGASAAMSGRKSELLNAELPAELAARARREGLEPQRAWLCAMADLNLAGQYETVYLLADEERLVTLGMPGEGAGKGGDGKAVRVSLRREQIQELRTRQGVGGGFVEALVDGVYVEVLAYSSARADVLNKAVVKLRTWLEGKRPEVGPADDVDPRRCPKCGMPLQFKGDLCRHCIRGGTVLLRVLKLMRPYAGRATLMMGLVLAAIGLSLVPQQLVRVLIDRVLAPGQAGHAVLPFARAAALLLWLVAALLVVHGGWSVLQTFLGKQASYVGTQITYDMRSKVFEHLSRLGVDYFDRYNVGQLMTRVAGDTEQMKGFVHQLTTGFLAQLITVLSVGAVLFTLNWKLGLITLLPAPLVVGAATFFWRRIYPRYYRVWDANSKLHGVLNTILSGIRAVKAFGQERREQDRFGRSSGYVRDSFRNVEYMVTRFNPMVVMLFHLGGILVWYVGGLWVLRGELTLGKLMAFLGYLWMFYQPLTQLTQLANWLTGFLTAAQRVFEILDTSPQISEAQAAAALPAGGGSIRFENVTFGYSRYEPVLRGVSFEVRAGEQIGIVGKSGSGKTTMINLLGRFYDADEGRVLVNGADVREMKLGDLRRFVGIVLQEPFLFRGTIHANVTYGRGQAGPEEVIAAAKAANAHEFIMHHPLGYDTYIGERGAGLSGGERQRVSIARALLYDPGILVLDEATSSVDTESEQLIQQALQRVTKGRTTIAIAHRLSTLRHSDRILVMDAGRIVESGTHRQLMDARGLYWRLVRIQAELAGGVGEAAARAAPAPVVAQKPPADAAAGRSEATREAVQEVTDGPDQTRARYLAPDMCRIHLGSHGALHVTVRDDRIYGGVYAAYAFPVAHPQRYICLMQSIGDAAAREVGIVRDLAEFPEPQRRLVQEALARRYFIHVIRRINAIGWKHGFVSIDAETDKGPVQFLMRWQQDRAVEYGHRGKVLIDVYDNRYLIGDLDALSARERSDFTRFIYW